MSRKSLKVSDLGYGTDTRDWVSVQHRTFTFWVNQALGNRGIQVATLEEAFQTGFNLVVLVEELSGRKLRQKVVENPKSKFEKLQNCSNALKFLESDGFKLVAFGPEDLVEPKLKLILGLVWMLILRYQIQKTSSSGNAKGELLSWIQQQIKPFNVTATNFTNSFGDGRVLCALVESLAPGTFSDINSLDASNKKQNTERALKAAQEQLGIPAIMEVEDFVDMEPDELSVMTYVSYYRNASEKGVTKKVTATVNASGDGLTKSVAGQKASFKLTALGSGVSREKNQC